MTTLIKMHHDVDGGISGFFTSYHVKEPKLEFCDTQFGDTTGMKEGDWMTDMHPIEPVPDKINVLDHHGIYSLKRNYHLIYDTVPASLIAWREFKEDIPKSEWWKVVIGITGDGQPEQIPYPVFESCPALLMPTKTYAGQSYGKWKINYFPTYKLLSSPINSFLRKREFDNALRLISEAKCPNDIIKDPAAIKAKADVKSEFEKIMRDCEIIPYHNLNVVIFYSDYRMSGYIASVIEGAEGKTTLAVNQKTGAGSLRGELALYWKARLSKLNYLLVDGHPGFMGVTLKKNHEVLIEDLNELLG